MNAQNVFMKSGAGTDFERMMMLDIEYSNYNYAGLDLAQVLSEFISSLNSEQKINIPLDSVQRCFVFANMANPLSGVTSGTQAEKLALLRGYQSEQVKLNIKPRPEAEMLKELDIMDLHYRMILFAVSSRFVALMGAHGFVHAMAFIADTYNENKRKLLQNYPDLAN